MMRFHTVIIIVFFFRVSSFSFEAAYYEREGGHNNKPHKRSFHFTDGKSARVISILFFFFKLIDKKNSASHYSISLRKETNGNYPKRAQSTATPESQIELLYWRPGLMETNRSVKDNNSFIFILKYALQFFL